MWTNTTQKSTKTESINKKPNSVHLLVKVDLPKPLTLHQPLGTLHTLLGAEHIATNKGGTVFTYEV